MWSSNQPAGIQWSQLTPHRRAQWPRVHRHLEPFRSRQRKASDDYVYRYDVDPLSGLERSLPLAGKDADAMELRICRAQDAIPDLERGQDSPSAANLFHPPPSAKPVTTPPANNHGQMALPQRIIEVASR